MLGGSKGHDEGCGIEVVREGAVTVKFGFLAEPFIEARGLGKGVWKK